MTDTSRGKGRPKGSEKDDSKALAAVADMICANPGLKPTTAMRRHDRRASATTIRRWQSKWRERSAALLADAEGRAATQARQRSVSPVGIQRSRFDAVAEAALTAQAVYNSPAMRFMREFQNSPTMRLARGLQDSPAMKLIRELDSNPVMKLVREQQREIARMNRWMGRSF